MNVSIKNRDFTNEVVLVSADLHPAELAWSALGGPSRATIDVKSTERNELWQLLDLLRSPLVVYDDQMAPCWWGFVSGVEIAYNNLVIGVTLDGLYNRIAVAYGRIANAGDTAGERATTEWVQDTESAGEYGIRELLYSSSATSDEHALAAQAMLIASYKKPAPVVTQARSMSGKGGISRSQLICQGWYQTLDWRYYANAVTNSLDTAEQAAAIATDKGQFFAGVVREVTSGIVTSPYRDGDASAKYWIDELCKMGTANNRRMLPTVDVNRQFILSEEPTSAQPFFIRSDGSLYDTFGIPLLKTSAPVGQWVRLQDVIPGSVDLNQFADPTLFFLESASYNVAQDWLSLTPRGIPGPGDVVRSIDG